ncbi:MAG: right-handed parallel beta-helix repeat-containing protein, partial [Planctomycetota bacterium]
RGLEVYIASWNFDSDPGWTADGQWAFGTPVASPWSACSDPNSAYSGCNVYGYNLEGDYRDGMPAQYLTTGPIDCSGYENIYLIFMRWLGVESSRFDNASVEVSSDSVNWTTIWANDEITTCDERWVEVSHDISTVAAFEPTVYIRWVMGPTDGVVTFGGWNIDDVKVVSVLGGSNAVESHADGFYSVLPPWNPSSITSRLEGLYCDIDHDCEPEALLEQPGVVPGDVVDFTWDSTSYNHLAEPSVYWHTNLVRDYYVALDPNLRDPSVGFPLGLDYPMPVTVQAWCPSGYCNAYWDGRGMTFGAGDGGSCDDFGLYAEVVYHEYTHGVTSKIYDGVYFPYAMEAGAMNEGWSDYFACVLSPSQSPLVGDGGLALDRPEGIRSLESAYRRDTDFVSGVHFDGQMLSSSLWQVRRTFEEQGRAETWDQMVHFTRYAHALAFEEYLLTLLVDDDARFGDGYLANGTPHGQAIHTAFGERGIGGLQYLAPSVVIADAAGNSNGELEPGETVNLSLSLRNEWADATQLSAKLSSSDPFVTIHKPVAGFADLEYGGMTDNSADPFVVSLDPACLGTHALNFLLEVTADGSYAYERKCFLTYPVGVGQLRYDYGQFDTYAGFVGPPGCALAVRVTPASYPCYPTRLRLLPYAGKDYSTEVTLWDDDGPGGLPGTILGSVQVEIRGDGDWLDVDISSLGLCIESGSFYAGWVQTGRSYYNGVDTDPPYYDRSWIYFYWGSGGEWVPFSGAGLMGNLMVRVRHLDTTTVGPVENLTVGRKYGHIQHAIDEGDAGDEIVVSEGVYGENVDFRGKNLTLRSEHPDDQAVVADAIIEGGYSGPAMRFDSGEDSNCVVAGLTIIGGSKSDENDGGISCLDLGQTGPVIRNCVITENRGPGIYARNSSPTIVNCDIVENEEDGVRLRSNSYPKMANCTIARNERNGIAGGYPEVANCTIVRNARAGVYHSRPVITNSIVRDNAEGNIDHFAEVTYSNVEGGWPGLGNIDTDPCFADPNTGDYRLKSWAGRWDPNQQSWVYDVSTSLCVDAGNPGSPLVIEANHPENVRVNMGTYGGTAQASRTPVGWSLLADLTNDGTVDFADLRDWVQDWLSTSSNQPADLDRNAMVSMPDWALFAQDWLAQTVWHE